MTYCKGESLGRLFDEVAKVLVSAARDTSSDKLVIEELVCITATAFTAAMLVFVRSIDNDIDDPETQEILMNIFDAALEKVRELEDKK